MPSHMASEQTQSTFETFSISEKFQSSFRAVPVQSRMAIEAAIEISSTFVALPVAVQLQSSYRAVSEQFQSNFRAISEQFQCHLKRLSRLQLRFQSRFNRRL